MSGAPLGRTACVEGVAAALGLVFAVWLLVGWGGVLCLRIVAAVGLFGFALFATVCAVVAARWASGRKRWAWVWLTIGLAGWTLGEALWSCTTKTGGLHAWPVPWPVQMLFLLLPMTACAAVLGLPAGYQGQSRLRLLLEALIIEASLLLMSWVLVLNSVYQSAHGDMLTANRVLTAAVADMVALTAAILVLGRACTGQRHTLTFLTAGMALMTTSDAAFFGTIARHAAYLVNLLVVGWGTGLLLLGIAALTSMRMPHTSPQRLAPLPAGWTATLPYVPTAAAAVVVTLAYLPGIATGPVAAAALVVMTAVLGHQFILTRENRQFLDAAAEQSMRDPLTGLANRALLLDRLTHAMQLHHRDQRAVAVISIDLDDFKLTNDTLGHAAGDAVLRQTAQRISSCVRTGDTVARFGGDEFIVLIEGETEPSDVLAQRIVAAFEQPFRIEGHNLLIRASVGLAEAPSDDSDLSADALLRHADVAMYSAKRSRAPGVHAFTTDTPLTAAPFPHSPPACRRAPVSGGVNALQRLGELRKAIDNSELTVVYQPKFDLRTAVVVGAEALVRWPHPELGLLSPDHFLPLVSNRGLMRAVTDLVLARALDDASHWRVNGVGIPVAVNLFAPSLSDPELPSQVFDALARCELPPNMLTLEITEDLLLEDMTQSRGGLDTLRKRGIRISLDDFGSGYSNLSYLHELPIDEVKLDRNLVAPVLSDLRAAFIARASIELAHLLNMTTVAEGVETAETASALRDYGCQLAQGFYYSPPITAATILALCRAPAHPPTGPRLAQHTTRTP